MKNITKYIIVILMTSISYIGYSQCENLSRLTTEFPVLIDDPIRPPIGPNPPISSPLSHERIVYWIHGYGGGENSWSKPMTISSSEPQNAAGAVINNELEPSFPARKMKPKAPSYDLGDLLPAMGVSVNEGILNGSESENQTPHEWKENYIIAHSFGGLAARQAEVDARASTDEDFRAGGIVTFGTVHHGAIFANNVIMVDPITPPGFSFETSTLKAAPPLENFINHGVAELTAGPLANPIVFLVLNLLGLEINAENLAEDLIKHIPVIIGDEFSPSALDLQVGSANINALQNNPNPTLNVAVYGNKKADLRVWKTLFWAANSPQDPPNKSTRLDGYFEAGTDKAAIDIFNKTLTTYEGFMFSAQRNHKKYAEKFQKFPCFGIVPPLPVSGLYCLGVKFLRDQYKRSADGFQRGVNWLQNSSKFFDELTGAISYSSTSSTECECFEDEDSHPGDCMQYELANGCVPITTTQITEIYKINDGITLMESNIDFPNLWTEPLIMPESSHFQMRNDENTADILSLLYGNVDPNEWDDEASKLRWFHIRGLNF